MAPAGLRTYPSLSGLGIYVSGFRALEGKDHWKKIFALLYWVNSQEELGSYWKYILLAPIGRIILTDRTESKYKQKSYNIFLFSGLSELAKDYGDSCLQNRSAKEHFLALGASLAKRLHIKFYSNLRPYNPKIRRRGYSRTNPVRPNSKNAIREANCSEEVLLKEGILQKSEEGGYEMESKRDIEQILFETFKNSLEAFKIYQQEELEKLRNRDPNRVLQSAVMQKKEGSIPKETNINQKLIEREEKIHE